MLHTIRKIDAKPLIFIANPAAIANFVNSQTAVLFGEMPRIVLSSTLKTCNYNITGITQIQDQILVPVLLDIKDRRIGR